MNKSDRILVILGAALLAFIVCMIVTFWVKDSVPDSLIQAVLGAGGIESLALAGIKIVNVLRGEHKAAESEEP